MNISDYTKEFSNLTSLVSEITSVIKTREDKSNLWASFKRENEDKIKNLLGITNNDIDNPCNLINFDIDDDKQLLLLNYTSQAHNVLHAYDDGWSNELKLCRGLVFSFSDGVSLVSRGFEKFFNANELKENTYESLLSNHDNKKTYIAYEKVDGHMIEYFEYDNQLCATTRGKFNTNSSLESLSLMSYKEWNLAKGYYKLCGHDLMSIVTELVTPSTEVLVNYEGQEKIYLLSAYDKSGNKIDQTLLKNLVFVIKNAKIPKSKRFTLSGMFIEVARRDIDNNEGWVLDLNGTLLKFKYNNYIGLMVSKKICYKYLMQRILTNTTEKMFSTLDDDNMKIVDVLKKNINIKVVECKKEESYKPLYSLWSDEEGSLNYFRLVCRKFYKEFILSI